MRARMRLLVLADDRDAADVLERKAAQVVSQAVARVVQLAISLNRISSLKSVSTAS